MKELLTIPIVVFESQAGRHPPEFRKAILEASLQRGALLDIPWDAYNEAIAKWPMDVKPSSSLGQSVDAVTAAKRASGCYDKDGNLIPGSPCAKKAIPRA